MSNNQSFAKTSKYTRIWRRKTPRSQIRDSREVSCQIISISFESEDDTPNPCGSTRRGGFEQNLARKEIFKKTGSDVVICENMCKFAEKCD